MMNIKLVLLLSILFASSASPDEEKIPLGYASVEDAFQSLTNDPNVEVQEEDGWVIVSQTVDGNYVLWSFTPQNHPAHPAAVKRIIFEKEGAVYIDMNALCQAPKAACDALLEEFRHLNDQIRISAPDNT